jgi:hypothetical protein
MRTRRSASLVIALLSVCTLTLIPAAAAPPNDDWRDAQELTFPTTVEVDVTDATIGEYEGECAPVVRGLANPLRGAPAVWYRFTTEIEYATLRWVALDDAVDARIWFESHDQLGFRRLSEVDCFGYGEASLWRAGTYYVSFDAPYADGDTVHLDLFSSEGDAPSNDVPYRARTIGALPFDVTQETFRAHVDYDDEGCPGRLGRVWYVYEAPVAQVLSLRVDDLTSGDTSIYAFDDATGATLACMGGTYRAPGTTEVLAHLAAGQRARINIGGGGRLRFRVETRPAMDSFADRRRLAPETPLPFTDRAASLEPAEPLSCGEGPSNWFEIAPGDAGWLDIVADGDVTAGLFLGSTLEDLTQTACGGPGLAVPRLDEPQMVQIRGMATGSIVLRSPTSLGTQVTDASPFAEGCGDPSSAHYPDTEVEVSAAVDPTDPQRVFATWQQDRHEDGGARGIGVGTSPDGGETWSRSVLYGLATCAGGTYARMTDPWVTVAGDGTAYVMTLAFNMDVLEGSSPSTPRGAGGAFVHRSTDHGMSWQGPYPISVSPGILFNDKNTITADPNIPGRVYATWQQVVGLSVVHVLARSDDGGITWLPPIPMPYGRVGDQLVVLDDGALVRVGGVLDIVSTTSRDGGLTWSEPSTIGITDSGEGPPYVRGGNYIPAMATDGSSVYVTWVNQTHVFVGISHDAGATWERRSIEACCVTRFTSSIAVLDDGTIGVTSYDVDLDTYMAHVLLATSTDGGATFTERAVTSSFALYRAPVSLGRGYFLGDYAALAASGDAFVGLYPAVPYDGTGRATNVYAQRLEP